MTKILGVGPKATVSAFNNSYHNYVQALKCRLFMYKDGSNTWVSKDSLPHTDSVYDDLLSDEFTFLTTNNEAHTPILVDRYHELYSGLKKRRYLRAGQSLIKDPRLTRKDWKIKMFIKFEKDIRSAKQDRVPRLISPPGDRKLVKDGCYVKAAEHSVYLKVNHMYGHVVVAKGMNYLQLGGTISSHWFSFVEPASFDLDVEKLDQSIRQAGLRKTHVVLCSFFSPEYTEEIMYLLSKQLSTHGKGRPDNGSVEYWAQGTLTSGQVNTSLVGVLLVTAIIHGYFRKLGVNAKLINCGDDCTIFSEKRDIHRIKNGIAEFFLNFAMRIKLSPVNEILEGIEFCQTRPIWTVDGYQMVRNVRDAIIKDGVCIDPLDNVVKAAKWINAIACGGINTHGGIPIFQDFYTCYARSADNMLQSIKLNKRQRHRVNSKDVLSVKKSSMSYWGKGMANKYKDIIDPRTRISFYKAFGIPPHQQIELECYYRKHLVVFSDLSIYNNEETTCSNQWY
jgi:hypothetical protein